jgi:hypothetical protein
VDGARPWGKSPIAEVFADVIGEGPSDGEFNKAKQQLRTD